MIDKSSTLLLYFKSSCFNFRNFSSYYCAEKKSDVTPSYPTSAKRHQNWDAVEQEVRQEEIDETREGDAALQKMFADIYVGAGASDGAAKLVDSPPENLLTN